MNPPNRTSPTVRPRPGHRDTAGLRDARKARRARSAVAIAAVAAIALSAGLGAVHCGLMRSGSTAPRAPQPVLTSQAGPSAATVDQPHLDHHRSPGQCHQPFAIAVLPQSSAASAEPGVVVALVAVTWHAQSVVAAGRGPPRGVAAPVTGQDRLARFCVTRR